LHISNKKAKERKKIGEKQRKWKSMYLTQAPSTILKDRLIKEKAKLIDLIRRGK